MSMTHGTNGAKASEDPPRPPSSHGSSSSGSSKHVKCIGRYVITGSLGKGNFARVESAVHTLTRAKVAVKIIETDKIKEDYVRKNLLREAQLMRRLRHPNIIRLYETMKTNNLYCLVTEIAEGGELLSHVRSDFKEKRLSEATTRPFIRQLVSALFHLHSVGIVHRDLKMENILLDKRKRQVKIVDFGLSNAAKPGSLLQTHCGSPEYAAPELFIPGKEYGPEVDVWSLGVNMYAMLVGKLPFRSPRQGTKRRQKLLEQISNGLTESHERELEHVSRGARDLIFRLLQPDPHHRVKLDEVMLHPWITKEGTQALHPFKYTPPDPHTQMTVIELMSTVLEVNPTEIKETARRDRCDWLAAIYNLLIDQPEGRNIIQRLIMDDPEEQLVDAAHYQGSMEHFRLSQGDNLDSYPPDVATMLHNATAHMRRTGAFRHASLSQPQAQSESGDYPSSTLPLTKREKQRVNSQEPHPLGGPRNLGPVHPLPPGYMLNRRASISSPVTSPEHHAQAHQYGYPQVSHMQPLPPDYYHGHHHQNHTHHRNHTHHKEHHSGKRKGKRMLPLTPNEEPYHHQQHPDVMRPHSRAESQPDPLPMPWKPNFAPQSQLVSHQHSPTSPIPHSVGPPPPSHIEDAAAKVYPAFKEPLLSPTQPPTKSASKKKLSPLRPKSVSIGSPVGGGSLSRSIDGLNLKPSIIEQPGSHTVSGVAWQQHRKIVPLRSKRNSEGTLHGWSSVQRLGQQPGDIQSLMWAGQGMPSTSLNTIAYDKHRLDVSANMHEPGSATSVEISPDLFAPSTNQSPVGSKGSSPQASTHFRQPPNPENLMLANRRLQHPLPPHNRSVSAKPSRRQELGMGQYVPELSNSMDHVGIERQRELGHLQHRQELPNLDDGKTSGRRGSIGELFSKAFGKNSMKEKSTSMTLHPKPV